MARALLAIGLLQFLTLLVGVLRAKGLSVSLGPDGMGVASTIDQIVLTITQLGALGVPFTALKFMSHAHSESAVAFKRVSRSFIRLATFLATVITATAMAVIVIWPGSIGAEMAAYVRPTLIALVGIAQIMVNALLVNLLASAQKPGAAAGLTFALSGVQGAAAVAGAAIGGIEGLYLATAVSGGVITIAALVYVRAHTGVSPIGEGASLRETFVRDGNVAITAASVYLTMVSYSGALLAVRYGVLAKTGETMAGLLHAALTIALTAGSLLTAMSALYLAPALNRATSTEEKIQLAHNFAGRMLALFMVGAIPVVLFPNLVVSVLYTDAFRPASVMIAGFLTWQCLYQGMNVYQQLLIGLNELRYMAFSAAIGLITAATLSVVFISRYGPGVVSLALIGGALLSGVLMLARLWFRHHMRAPVYLIVRLGLVIVAIALGHSWFSPQSELQPMGLTARAGFASIGFLLLSLQLTPSERGQILALIKATMRKLSPTAPSPR